MTNNSMRLILSDIRSSGNVGAMLRTADAANIDLVYACGCTPYPLASDDTRPAHVADSNMRAIAKTALGAETTVPVLHVRDTTSAILKARTEGYKIIVLEQSEKSLNLYRYAPAGPIAIVVGSEVEGIPADILDLADTILELPMLGTKESLNVATATGIALYQLRFGA
jgi:23S rRNA (guanosine2251-2'-O)-methyltransferase